MLDIELPKHVLVEEDPTDMDEQKLTTYRKYVILFWTFYITTVIVLFMFSLARQLDVCMWIGLGLCIGATPVAYAWEYCKPRT